MALFSKYVPLKSDLDRYLADSKKVFEEIGDRQSARLVEGFLNASGQQRFRITIMGSLKRGKSTLLNTLMERPNDDISPIASEVCTSAIVQYLDMNLAKDRSGEHAVLHFEDSGKPSQAIPLSRLRDYVTETNNPENRKRVRSVETYGDFPDWSKAVTIVDSPGQNAVYDYHDALLSDFLPHTDAMIFLISADLPIDGGDLKLLKTLAADQKKRIFFVITMADRVPEDDLDAVKERVEKVLDEAGLPFDKIYCTSAKPVFEKLREGCAGEALENEKAEHGILELERDLESFILRESDENKVFVKRAREILEATEKACREYSDDIGKLLTKQQIDLASLQQEEATLKAGNAELQQKADKSIRKFERDWKRVIEKVHGRFATKADEVADKVQAKIQKGDLVNAISTSFTLKQMLQKELASGLQPVVDELNEKARAVEQTLSEELEEETTCYLKKLRDSDFTGRLVGTGGSMIAIGVGVAGLLVASSAAIKAANALGALGEASWVFKLVKNGAHAAKAGAAMADLATFGLSLAGTLAAEWMLKVGLKEINKGRVDEILEKALSQSEEQFGKALEEYGKSLASQYRQRVGDLIDQKTERLEEVRRLMEKNDPTEREQLEKKRQDAENLLQDCLSMQKQLSLAQ